MSRSEELAANLADVNARITRAAEQAGRDPASITLVAVTKTWPASDAALLRDLGVVDLAENRDQQASQKAAEIGGVRWHFVGQVQTNKARAVRRDADVVHSVDRVRLADALHDAADDDARRLDVLVQVNLTDDPARGGVAPKGVEDLAEHILAR